MEDSASLLSRATRRRESRSRPYLRSKDTPAKYVVHDERLCSVDIQLPLLNQSFVCCVQEGCMKPGDKLLAVNGESVLGYTVEQVTVLPELSFLGGFDQSHEVKGSDWCSFRSLHS